MVAWLLPSKRQLAYMNASDRIEHYLAVTNETAKPFVWTKTADEILASVARFCERTSNSGH